MSVAKCGPLHDLCGPNQIIRHSQTGWALENNDRLGCQTKDIALVWQFPDGMQARVQTDGKHSKSFSKTNGVKHGCVMASALFSMMFSAILTDAFQDCDAFFYQVSLSN